MTTKLTINEPEIAKLVFNKFLIVQNQKVKKVHYDLEKTNASYITECDKAIVVQNDYVKQHVEIIIKEPKCKKTIEEINSMPFEKINSKEILVWIYHNIILNKNFKFFLNSLEFFEFTKAVKEEKLEIISIEIDSSDLSIVINTNRFDNFNFHSSLTQPDFYHQYSIYDKHGNFYIAKKLYEDYEPQVSVDFDFSFITETKFLKSFSLVCSLSEENVGKVEEYFYEPKDDEIYILLTPKDIVDKSVTSTLNVKIYPMSEIFFLVVLTIDNPSFTIKEYFKIVAI